MTTESPESKWLLLRKSLRRFAAGAVSGTLTAALLQPLDVIRTRQQGQRVALADRASRQGLVATARAVIHEEGASALWKGIGPTIVRVFFGAGIYFSALNGFMDLASSGRGRRDDGLGRVQPQPPPPSFVLTFASGAVARSVAATAMSPVAVVKTRAEWATGATPYSGTLSGVRHIVATEGVAALYSGLLPTLLRDVPFSGAYFMLYSQFKHWTDSPAVAAALPLHSARNFGASLAASVLATLLTQPVDVVRTRLQLRAVDGATTWRAGTILLKGIADVARVEGARTLFTGALSRVVKRSVSTAITWTMFEEAMRTST